MLRDDFIAYLEEQVNNHSIYVWGAQGEAAPTITEEWIRKKENGDPKQAARAIVTWKRQVAAGYGSVLRAFDCSGLGMYFFQNKTGVVENDLSSNAMLKKCIRITKSDLQKGDWVFRTDATGKAYHIGYVVDDALHVIEAKGRDEGVVKRKLHAAGSSYWNAFGRPTVFFFPNADAGKNAPTAESNAPGAYFAVCAGGSVHVRAAESAAAEILCTAHKGDALLALPENNGFCAVALLHKNRLITGYMCARYVKEVPR
ncbi:NlpC/P60 family protein [Christensenellaceae bacterium OttesenSCG-928-L17]|nr:NlpC/P60 family protein [Christensenellaceae bacterium OttesenSCG-928-L17]